MLNCFQTQEDTKQVYKWKFSAIWKPSVLILKWPFGYRWEGGRDVIYLVLWGSVGGGSCRYDMSEKMVSERIYIIFHNIICELWYNKMITKFCSTFMWESTEHLLLINLNSEISIYKSNFQLKIAYLQNSLILSKPAVKPSVNQWKQQNTHNKISFTK